MINTSTPKNTNKSTIINHYKNYYRCINNVNPHIKPLAEYIIKPLYDHDLRFVIPLLSKNKLLYDNYIPVFTLQYFLCTYKYNEHHMYSRGHTAMECPKGITCGNNMIKSFFKFSDWIMNHINCGAILNNLFFIKKICYKQVRNDGVEYISVELPLLCFGVDMKNKCETNWFTIQINHNKSNYHIYPDSDNDESKINVRLSDDIITIIIDIKQKLSTDPDPIDVEKFNDDYKNIYYRYFDSDLTR